MRKLLHMTALSIISLLTLTSCSVRQEWVHEPGDGLTVAQTVLYFVIAPASLFLTIVVVGYAVHRPRDKKPARRNVLNEIN